MCNMKFLDNHWASITCGRSRTRIAGMSRESFPELPQMPEPIAEMPVKALASMIARTSFAISMEESRFTLNGALLLMRPEGLTMVATDGHRLAYVQASPAESGTADKPFRALVPKKAMSELTKLSDDAGADAKAIVAGDDNHLFFQVGDRLLITPQADRQFPGLRARAAQGSPSSSPSWSSDEIRAAIERVAQFADERSRAIRVQFAAGEVRVFTPQCRRPERAKRACPASTTGPDIEIGFNAQYLLDFLRAISQDQVAFEFKDQKSAGELRPGGDGIADQYRYVVMPMRI